MIREELQNQFGIAICEYCRKHVISEYNLRKGGFARRVIIRKHKMATQQKIT